MGDPACFRVSSLAERWDCSPGKIRQMIAAGELTCLRLGKMVPALNPAPKRGGAADA